MSTHFIVSYDVSHDGRRAKMAAVASAYGDRIQLSVFECTLSRSELTDLVGRLEALADPKDDSVHVIPVCRSCEERRVLIGQAFVPPDEPFWVV